MATEQLQPGEGDEATSAEGGGDGVAAGDCGGGGGGGPSYDEADGQRRGRRDLARGGASSSSAVGPAADNSYAAVKSLAQRVMDMTLLSANVHQLRNVLHVINGSGATSDWQCTLLKMELGGLIISLLLQVAVAATLIWRSNDSIADRAAHDNKCVVLMVFLLTVINMILISLSSSGVVTYSPPTFTPLSPKGTSPPRTDVTAVTGFCAIGDS